MWIPLVIFIIPNVYAKTFEKVNKIDHKGVKVELVPETSYEGKISCNYLLQLLACMLLGKVNNEYSYCH